MGAAAKDATRFQMHAVLFAPNGDIVATDGKRMFIGSTADDGKPARPVIVALPSVKLAVKTAGAQKVIVCECSDDGRVFRFIIPPAELMKARRLTLALVGECPHDEFCTIIAGDLVEGDYPPYERAIPKSGQFEILLSPEYLRELCATAKALTTVEDASIRLRFTNCKTAMVAETPAGPFGRNRWVLMPLVTDAERDRMEAEGLATAPIDAPLADAGAQAPLVVVPTEDQKLSAVVAKRKDAGIDEPKPKSPVKGKAKSKAKRKAKAPGELPDDATVELTPKGEAALDKAKAVPVTTVEDAEGVVVYAYTVKADGETPKSCRIRTPDKPDDATIADFKASGWWWIRTGKYWVNKAAKGAAMVATFPGAVRVDVID